MIGSLQRDYLLKPDGSRWGSRAVVPSRHPRKIPRGREWCHITTPPYCPRHSSPTRHAKYCTPPLPSTDHAAPSASAGGLSDRRPDFESSDRRDGERNNYLKIKFPGSYGARSPHHPISLVHESGGYACRLEVRGRHAQDADLADDRAPHSSYERHQRALQLAKAPGKSHYRPAKGASGGDDMATTEVHLDGELFSADVVARTAHRYTNDYFVEVRPEAQGYSVLLTPQSPGAEDTILPHRFRNDALDERLRERVRDETRDLQDTLIQAALREAKPRSSSTQS